MKLNNKPTFLYASQNVVGFYNKIFNIRRLINYPRKFICWPSLLPGMWRYPSSKIKRMRILSLFTNKYVYVLTYDLKSQKYVYVLTYVDVDQLMLTLLHVYFKLTLSRAQALFAHPVTSSERR